MSVPVLQLTTWWYCQFCTFRDVTHEVQPHSRMHACSGLGLTVPMIPEGESRKVTVREREDYIGSDDVQKDVNGRPVMSIVTTRDDGEDVVVFAPTAHVRIG